MKKQEFYFSSANKEARMRAVEWLPEGEPKAVLHICCDQTGQKQYSEELAEYFSMHGFVVIACKVFAQIEMSHCLQTVKNKYADVPHLLLGCSEGAVTVRSFIHRYPEAVEGAVLADIEQCMAAPDEKLPVLQISGVIQNRQEAFRQIFNWTEERLDEMLYQAATKYKKMKREIRHAALLCEPQNL